MELKGSNLLPTSSLPPGSTALPASSSPPASTTVPASSSPPGSTAVPTSSSPPPSTAVPASSSPPVRPLRPQPPSDGFSGMTMRRPSYYNFMADRPSSRLLLGWRTQGPAVIRYHPRATSPTPTFPSLMVRSPPPRSCRLPAPQGSYIPVTEHGTPGFITPPPDVLKTPRHHGRDFSSFSLSHDHPSASDMSTPQQVPTIISPSGTSASSSSSYFRTEAPYEHLSYGRIPTQATETRRIGDTQESGSRSAGRSGRLIFQAAPIDRESVERTLMAYHALRRRHLQLEEAEIKKDGDRRRNSFHAHLQAAAKMKDQKLRLTEEKRVGTIPGVEVGDMYYYRAEMTMIGLHSPAEAGIDYTTIKFNGVEDTVAISIVTFSGHQGDVDDGEVLIYRGHAGHKKGKTSDDQKLERGNLALDRSMNRGVEIRVTRGFKDPTHMNRKVYVYDGLYKIMESWMEKNSEGFNVYKCKLVRLPGQPTLGSLIWKLTQRWKENPSCRDEALATDISIGRETNPICLVNGVDDERELLPFVYISKLRNAVAIRLSRPAGACKCVERCKPMTGALCSCFQANGNEFPFADNGTLVRRMPVVFECGSSCSCVYGCPNRVSQQGLYFHFEVFRTRDRGWGLRSWDLIPAGAFICELAGEVTTREKVRTDGDDEYVFDTERATARPLEWEGMYEVIGKARPQSSGMDVGAITIVADARRTGNLSRFINHSCSPTVFWQLVVYDKHGMIFPRVVFFAMKNIPPLTELTYDYGVSGTPEAGKKCLCGSANCRGRFG